MRLDEKVFAHVVESGKDLVGLQHEDDGIANEHTPIIIETLGLGSFFCLHFMVFLLACKDTRLDLQI